MHFSGLGGISLSEEYAKATDIERLEERIENLRLTVIVLTIIISLLSIYVIIQSIPQDLFILLFGAGGLIILCLLFLNKSCIKEK